MTCKQHGQKNCKLCFGKGTPLESPLDVKLQKAVKERAETFGLDPGRTLYVSEKPPKKADCFLASNEFHWRGLPAEEKRLRADVAISVGSNMGWDQALENNCTALVVFDFHPSIAQIHEWVYRPLLLVASTPLDFLRALTCLDAPVEHAGEFLAAHKKLFSKESSGALLEKTHEFHLKLLEQVGKVAKEFDIPVVAQEQLARYFAGICGARGCKTCSKAAYPFELGHFEWGLDSAGGDLSGVLLKHFSSRYLDEKDEARECWASAPSEFAKLQTLMRYHLYYVVGDLFDPADEVMWCALGETFRFSRWSLNVSNVIDFVDSMSVHSRRPKLLTGLFEALHKKYEGLSLEQLRLRKLLEIETLLLKAQPDLAVILYYYTVGGLDLRAMHIPKHYIHFAGIPVAFDKLA